MKVFISSLIGGFEPFRQAARSAVVMLRHEPVMAEDFRAQPNSPQVACLQGVRDSALVVLILGERYGSVQGTSGVSPTHEEFMEARDTKQLLVFVQEGVERDAQQTKFVAEVQGWQTGRFRSSFRTAEQLKDLVTGALHDYELAHASGPLDLATLTKAALELLPRSQRNHHSGLPMLHVAVAGGPIQRVLRPAELEKPTLLQALHKQALFGSPALFNSAQGMTHGLKGAALCLQQDRGARIQLDEQAALVMSVSLNQPASRGRSSQGFAAIIEEVVVQHLTGALAFADWTLEQIDATQRLTHVVVAATIEAGDYMGWRNRTPVQALESSTWAVAVIFRPCRLIGLARLCASTHSIWPKTLWCRSGGSEKPPTIEPARTDFS